MSLKSATSAKALVIFLALMAGAAACGDSEEPVATAASSESVPEELGFAEMTKKPRTTLGKQTTSSAVAKSSITTTVVAPASSSSSVNVTSTTATLQTTCSTPDYQVVIPQGWNTAPSGSSLHCSGFTTIALPASLECDCTISVNVNVLPIPAGDAIVSLTNSSSANLNVSSVLNGNAELITGEWLLSEVQTGDSTSTEQQYTYVFEDGANTILVSAGEFADFDSGYSFAAGKLAVDELAASLVIL